jgi:HSP20 family molecular chaperone IbpA
MKILETISRTPPFVEQVRIGKRKDFGERLCEIHNRIGELAYQIFERKGKKYGHDVEDWLEAEKELFAPVKVEVIEAEFSFLVHARIDSLRGADLEIHAEPRRLYVLGKKIAKGWPWKSEPMDARSGEVEIYRVIEFPVDVNPAMATAHIKNGVLEIFILKTGKARWPETALQAA